MAVLQKQSAGWSDIIRLLQQAPPHGYHGQGEEHGGNAYYDSQSPPLPCSRLTADQCPGQVDDRRQGSNPAKLLHQGVEGIEGKEKATEEEHGRQKEGVEGVERMYGRCYKGEKNRNTG